MRDLPQAYEDFFKHYICQHQRIAAGKDNISNLGMFFEVLKGTLQAFHRDFLIITDFSFTRTKTAVQTALARNQEQSSVRVTMRNIWNGTHSIFHKRIFFSIKVLQLGLIRNTLLPDRISRIPYQA